MNKFHIHIPFNIYSACAVSSARRYVNLIENQLSQAQTDDHREALKLYRESGNHDEVEHEIQRRDIDRYYDDDFRPIHYFASVVYLYMVFERFVFHHAADIQSHFNEDPEFFKKSKKPEGLIKAAQAYFRDKTKLTFFAEEQWTQLLEISHVRNCIVHDAGIPLESLRNRDSIYALEVRMWRGQPVGLQIDRKEGRDLGWPMILNQRFLEYCLCVLEDFFHALGTAVEVEMGK